jgi:hypothetical protein
LVFTAQDPVSGVSSVRELFGHFNTTLTVSPFTPGTTGPITATFTKKHETLGGKGGIQVTSESGKRVRCEGVFKTVMPFRVNSLGFTTRDRFDNLVVQNGALGLNAVRVTLNGGTPMTIPLTPGQTFTQTLATGVARPNRLVVQGLGLPLRRAVMVLWGQPEIP